MPIYGYRCKQCDHEFEIVQRMTDDALKVCPECMGPLQKQLYPAGIVFKGSGFYKTDYASASSKSTEGSEGGSSSVGESDSSKSDSSKADAPKPDSSSSDAPKADAAKAESPKKESKSASSGSKE